MNSYLLYFVAAMAQSVERHLGKVEVTGSIPVSSFEKRPWIQGFFLPKNNHQNTEHFDG